MADRDYNYDRNRIYDRDNRDNREMRDRDDRYGYGPGYGRNYERGDVAGDRSYGGRDRYDSGYGDRDVNAREDYGRYGTYNRDMGNRDMEDRDRYTTRDRDVRYERGVRYDVDYGDRERRGWSDRDRMEGERMVVRPARGSMIREGGRREVRSDRDYDRTDRTGLYPVGVRGRDTERADYGAAMPEDYEGYNGRWPDRDRYLREDRDYRIGDVGYRGLTPAERAATAERGMTPMTGEHYGRGPKNYQRPDDRIREDVSDRLMYHGDVDATNLEVRVENGEVTLEGEVDDRDQKRLAEDLAEDVRGVRDVHNRLKVKGGLLGGLFGGNDRNE